MNMRVLAIADVADKRLWDMLDRRLLEGVELVLSCGDLPAEYLSFLTCFTRAPILYVRGNHDDRYFKKPPEGCECAEDRIINVGGVRVLGLGGSMRYRESECMFTEREMKARIRRLYWKLRKSGGFDILLTHAPALDFGDGDNLPHRGFQCFVVIDCQDRGAVADGQIGVNRADSRIVQSGRDRVGLFDLSVFALHDQGTGSVYDSFLSQLDGGGAHT